MFFNCNKYKKWVLKNFSNYKYSVINTVVNYCIDFKCVNEICEAGKTL